MFFTVEGDFQDGDSDDKRNLRGFFLQEKDVDADSNPNTSEGIFVYDPNTLADVNLGDVVRSISTLKCIVFFNSCFPMLFILSNNIKGSSYWDCCGKLWRDPNNGGICHSVIVW